MFALPPKGDAHWVYDDPSGVPETPVSQPVLTPKRGKVVRFPFPAPAPLPATPKAA
jgi:hypothetical protein